MLTSLAKAYRRGAQIDTLGEVYRKSRSAIISWCLGVTQQEHAVDTIRGIVNVLLMRANIGREGAGPCPIRGHSDVQGNRTCGIDNRPSEEWLARLDKACGIHSPREHGLDTVRVIPAMMRGEVKVFVGMGGNFVLAAPDTAYTFLAVQKCGLRKELNLYSYGDINANSSGTSGVESGSEFRCRSYGAGPVFFAPRAIEIWLLRSRFSTVC